MRHWFVQPVVKPLCTSSHHLQQDGLPYTDGKLHGNYIHIRAHIFLHFLVIGIAGENLNIWQLRERNNKISWWRLRTLGLSKKVGWIQLAKSRVWWQFWTLRVLRREEGTFLGHLDYELAKTDLCRTWILQLAERNHKLLGVFGVPSLQNRADCYCNREMGWGWDGVKATVGLEWPGEGLFN